MQWWNRLKSILTSKLQIKSSLTKLPPNELSICFVENGGLGDCLILFPLLEQIKQQAPCPLQIDFFSKFGNKFHAFPFLRAIYPSPKDVTCLSNQYDVVFVQLRHAHVLSANEPKVQQLYPKLFEFIATDKKLKNNPSIYNNFRLFNEYALLLNCKRTDQRDIFHIFGKIPAWNWPIHTPEKEVLKKFHLNSKQYITLSRGVDSVYNENHPKLWPLAYYNQLIELLKQKYPQLQLIQVESSTVYGTMQNSTFNLTGKTNFDEIAIILKNALIHIDVEGGLVHLNH
ncbi:MAG: hypothetical protein J6Q05_00685, partial [Elusimicrobiaceae bacterium]|nr:hypothetical protein [Elusimicrobiaceae bacterium]